MENAAMSTTEEEPKLLHCQVVPCALGNGASITYRWEGLDVDGHDSIEDDCSDWTDDEIRDSAATIIGAETPENHAKIEVCW